MNPGRAAGPPEQGSAPRSGGSLGPGLPAVLTWALLLLAAPFADLQAGTAAVWGLGAAGLIAVFPWILVRTLDRRGDLRAGLSRLGAPPVILGAAGAGFVLLRVILWLDGPRPLAAVILAMIAGYAAVVVVGRHRILSWDTASSAAAALILPALLLPSGVPAAAAGGVVAVLGLIAALASDRDRRGALLAAAVGAVVSGGLGLWLLAVAP